MNEVCHLKSPPEFLFSCLNQFTFKPAIKNRITQKIVISSIFPSSLNLSISSSSFALLSITIIKTSEVQPAKTFSSTDRRSQNK
jgi:hypothetical protein